MIKIYKDIKNKIIIKDNKYICPICNKEYSKNGIGSHIWRTHSEESKNFNPNKGYNTGIRIGWNKGLTKYTDERVKKSGITFSKRNKLGLYNFNRHLSNDTKIKISNSMKKAHKEGRAWNIGKSRWKNKPSYPEKFFMNVIDNEFNDKYYQREYPFFKYSLDFAWEHKKKCIEIDGGQHERFIDYKLRDNKKDNLLKQNGWQILRIRYIDLYHNTKYWIKVAKDFIDNDNYDLKLIDNFYKVKNNSKNKVKVNKVLLNKQKLKDKRWEIIKNSNIDFSKKGWISKIGPLFNIKYYNRAANYIRIHFPEFYKNNCYKQLKRFKNKFF